jgi:hypothetical protein
MSERFPTMTGGNALVLHFLPNGEVEYRVPSSQP